MASRKKDSARVVIAVPLATPLIYWKTVAAILDMERPGECDLMVFQGALVDRARNHLIDRMLQHPIDPTHIFFLDADVVPPPDALCKLLRADRPIVSGMYRKRIPPYEVMAFREGKGKILVPILPRGPRLREVDVVGAGCLLIRREVFEKIAPPWFSGEWIGSRHLSEDFSFCRKAREAGFGVFVDTSVRAVHLEPMGVGFAEDGSVRIS